MVEDEVYVMLMMMRADENYTSAEGCTAEELLACTVADDIDACMAACNGNEEGEEENLPGYATVSTKAAAAQTVALNAVDKKVGTVTLKAGENDTTVTAIEITKAGLGDAKDVATISLMKNGEYVTNSATLTNKVAKLRFRPSLTLKANGSETFDVVVSMAGKDAGATAGGQHEFSVTSVTVSNGTFGGTPAKLGSLTTSNYEVSPITVVIDDLDADAGDKEAEIISVNLKSAKADATVNSLTIIAENMADSWSDVIANAKAYIDDEVVGTVTVNEETIVVNGLNEKIKKGKDIDVVIKADVVYVGEMATPLSLDAEHVIAYEDSTNERMSLEVTKGSFLVDNGIGLTLTNNVKKNQKVVKDAEDVVLMDIDVESAADIEVLEYTLVFDDTALTTTDQLEDLRISVDGDEFDLPMSLFDSDTSDLDIDNWEINLADKYLNVFTVDAGKKVNIKVLATVRKPETANAYKVTLLINRIKAIDTKNTIGDPYPAAELDSEESHETTVADASFVITPKSTDGNTIRIGETKDVLSFTAKAKSEDLKVKTLTFQIQGLTAAELKDVVDYVTIDGKKVLVKDMDDTDPTLLEGEVTLNKTIKEGEATTFTVSLKVASSVDVDLLGEKINVVVPANGLYAKGVTSDGDVYNTDDIEGTLYQLVTTKPEVELSQDGKFITVTFNNESDYTVGLVDATIEVLSERNDQGVNLLPAVTKWNVRKNTKNGNILATEAEVDVDADGKDIDTRASELPGIYELAFLSGDFEIAEGETMTFVIEMNTTVNVKSTDYTIAAKSFSYQYRNEDTSSWGTQIDEDL